MSQSFFDLTPDNDPHQVPSDESFSYCNLVNCAAYTEAAHNAIMQASEGLSDALSAALDAYNETHPELTYAIIFHAIDCLAFCLRHQMQEDTADA